MGTKNKSCFDCLFYEAGMCELFKKIIKLLTEYTNEKRWLKRKGVTPRKDIFETIATLCVKFREDDIADSVATKTSK